MNQDINDYLETLRNEMKENEELRTVYGIYGRRICKIGSSNSQPGAMLIIKNYLNEYEVKDDDIFLIINHAFSLNKFLHGPFILSCAIVPVKSSGKINTPKIKSGEVHYLPKELKTRGFKKGDYRRLYKKIKSGEIQTGVKKWYSAKHLD